MGGGEVFSSGYFVALIVESSVNRIIMIVMILIIERHSM